VTFRMTPRERIMTLLSGSCPDRVPWFGDLDYLAYAMTVRGERGKDFRTSDEYIDWHRDLGVGFYLQGHFPFRTVIENCDIREWRDGDDRFREIETPYGTLRECWRYRAVTFSDAPVEYLLKSSDDIQALRHVYENTNYEADYYYAEQRKSAIGDQGFLLCYVPKSPFMQLVVLEALTPAPIGDVAIEDFADYSGESKSILWGGMPGVYFTDKVSDDEFEAHCRRVLNVMKKEPRYVLGVADQVPPDALIDRVKRVGEIVGEYGMYD